MMPFVFGLIIVVLVFLLIVIHKYNRTLGKYIKQMSSAYSDEVKTNSRIRHEWNGLLEEIHCLILSGDETSLNMALELIDDSVDVFQTINNNVYSNNLVINSVLSIINDRAQDMNISLSCDINVPAELNISAIELLVSYRNLLMNALEATSFVCSQSKEGIAEINVKSQLVNDYLVIKVKNPCVKNLIVNKTSISSVKTEMDHGFGIGILKSIAKKRNGKFQMLFENNYCETVLWLQN